MDVVGTFIGLLTVSRFAACRIHVVLDLDAVARHACRGPGGRMSSALPQLLRLTIEIISGAILPSSKMRPTRSEPCSPSAISVCMSGELLLEELRGGQRLPNCFLSSPYWRARNQQSSAAPITPQEMPYRARLRQPNGPLRPDHVGQQRVFAHFHALHDDLAGDGTREVKASHRIFGADSPPSCPSRARSRGSGRHGQPTWPRRRKTSAIGALEIQVFVAGQTVAGGGLFGARLHAAGIGAGIGLGQAETADQVRRPPAPAGTSCAALPSHRRGSGA